MEIVAIDEGEFERVTEVLGNLRRAFTAYKGGNAVVQLASVTAASLITRSYSSTPIPDGPAYLMVVLDTGVYLIDGWAPCASACRRIPHLRFMKRKSPTHPLSNTVVKVHLVSRNPFALVVVDSFMFDRNFLGRHKWSLRTRIAQVELCRQDPAGSVQLRESSMGLYFFYDVDLASAATAIPPSLEWFGCPDDPDDDDVFGADNVDFRLSAQMRLKPLPEPCFVSESGWRSKVAWAMFDGNWVRQYGRCVLDASELEKVIQSLYPAGPSKRSRDDDALHPATRSS
ncbi:unnamed protein product (mitochondrion) [Plasmodiophora brassicae]|uniref:Uncharacterized protein n=1 Tax=Plasmodiophora brassicae TaxID=37360 RepID=A0A3P3Y586_PLABS|nr:unnamed protein product [Plasmodiophora brassicae]